MKRTSLWEIRERMVIMPMRAKDKVLRVLDEVVERDVGRAERRVVGLAEVRVAL